MDPNQHFDPDPKFFLLLFSCNKHFHTDPHMPSKPWIQIRIKWMRIRNPALPASKLPSSSDLDPEPLGTNLDPQIVRSKLIYPYPDLELQIIFKSQN